MTTHSFYHFFLHFFQSQDYFIVLKFYDTLGHTQFRFLWLKRSSIQFTHRRCFMKGRSPTRIKRSTNYRKYISLFYRTWALSTFQGWPTSMTCVTRNPLWILYSFAKLTTTTVYRVYVTNFFDSIKGPGSAQSSPSYWNERKFRLFHVKCWPEILSNLKRLLWRLPLRPQKSL